MSKPLQVDQGHIAAQEAAQHTRDSASPEPSASEYSVQCEFCGEFLRGIHAQGNLKRHYKTPNCLAAQGNDSSTRLYKCEFCQFQGYQDSDGILKHMREVHQAKDPIRTLKDNNVITSIQTPARRASRDSLHSNVTVKGKGESQTTATTVQGRANAKKPVLTKRGSTLGPKIINEPQPDGKKPHYEARTGNVQRVSSSFAASGKQAQSAASPRPDTRSTTRNPGSSLAHEISPGINPYLNPEDIAGLHRPQQSKTRIITSVTKTSVHKSVPPPTVESEDDEEEPASILPKPHQQGKAEAEKREEAKSPRKPLRRSGNASLSRPARRPTIIDERGPSSRSRRTKDSPIDSGLDISYSPFDQRTQRSDPTPSNRSNIYTRPPGYPPQPNPYTLGAAIVQPTQTMRRRSSYHGSLGQDYSAAGMPVPYPSPPQEYGLPPSLSAYHNINNIMGATPPNSFIPPGHPMHTASPYDARPPPMPSHRNATFSARRPVSQYRPPLVTQDLGSQRLGRSGQNAVNSAPFLHSESQSSSSEYESSEEDEKDDERARMPPPPRPVNPHVRRPSLRQSNTTLLQRQPRPTVTQYDTGRRLSVTERRRPNNIQYDTGRQSYVTERRRPSTVQYDTVQQANVSESRPPNTTQYYTRPHIPQPSNATGLSPPGNPRDSWQVPPPPPRQYTDEELKLQDMLYGQNPHSSRTHRDSRDFRYDFDARNHDRDMSWELAQRADVLLRDRESMMSRTGSTISTRSKSSLRPALKQQKSPYKNAPPGSNLSSQPPSIQQPKYQSPSEPATSPAIAQISKSRSSYETAPRKRRLESKVTPSETAKNVKRSNSTERLEDGSFGGRRTISHSNRTTITNGAGGEIRLRVDASSPHLQFNGDMEGRTMHIEPVEGGMADIIIGNARGNMNTYRSARGSLLASSRKPVANETARREAEEASVRSAPSRISQGGRDRQRRPIDDESASQPPAKREATRHQKLTKATGQATLSKRSIGASSEKPTTPDSVREGRREPGMEAKQKADEMVSQRPITLDTQQTTRDSNESMTKVLADPETAAGHAVISRHPEATSHSAAEQPASSPPTHDASEDGLVLVSFDTQVVEEATHADIDTSSAYKGHWQNRMEEIRNNPELDGDELWKEVSLGRGRTIASPTETNEEPTEEVASEEEPVGSGVGHGIIDESKAAVEAATKLLEAEKAAREETEAKAAKAAKAANEKALAETKTVAEEHAESSQNTHQADMNQHKDPEDSLRKDLANLGKPSGSTRACFPPQTSHTSPVYSSSAQTETAPTSQRGVTYTGQEGGLLETTSANSESSSQAQSRQLPSIHLLSELADIVRNNKAESSMYELEPGFGTSQVLFPPSERSIFRNPHYNTAHFLNPDFQPEEWSRDVEYATDKHESSVKMLDSPTTDLEEKADNADEKGEHEASQSKGMIAGRIGSEKNRLQDIELAMNINSALYEQIRIHSQYKHAQTETELGLKRTALEESVATVSEEMVRRSIERDAQEGIVEAPLSVHKDSQAQFSQLQGILEEMQVSEQSVTNMRRYHHSLDDDDSVSVISSYANSVFSVESLTSSATDLSKGSGYSASQIATATRELVLIFHGDDVLVPLYQSALKDDAIGAERLERNLRRLFKAYAKQLEDEAIDRLEYLASRLVAIKARYLAESIIEKFQGESNENKAIPDEKDESSDEEDKPAPVNEGVFEDLVVFRDFLVHSEAFQALRTQVRQFVLPQPDLDLELESLESDNSDKVSSEHGVIEGTKGEEANYSETDNFDHAPTQHRGRWPKLKQYWEAISIATGQLEPPVSAGRQRLRWKCRCGKPFFDDVTELREGGIAQLKARMRYSSAVNFEPECKMRNSSQQRYIYSRPFSWVQNGVGKFFGSMRQASKTSTLPQSNPCPTMANANCVGSNLRQQILHIMACMHKGRNGKNLFQDRVETLTTDRQLFKFLKNQYTSHRGKLRTVLTLHGIQGIFFVKFRLPMGGSVEVRHHDPCCQIATCECLPPESKVEPSPQAEYRCRPIPPTVVPPVLPEYLMHLFTSPSCINENDTWILDQLPKRTCGELHGRVGQPAEGWGIYYKEGWDRDKITLIMFIFFLLGSLLFGTLWARFRMDMQGAFGVSAYMVAACGILVTFIATRLDKP